MKQVTCEGGQESLGAPGRNRVEEALRESEERCPFLTENMLDVVWVAGLDLRTTYVSPSVEKVLGFTPEERKRQVIEETVTPESLREIQKRFAEELQRDREPGTDLNRSLLMEVEYYRKDGSTMWMESRVQTIRDAEENVARMFGISRDITKRKRAEMELERRSKERRILLDTIPVQVWYLTNPDTYGALNMAHADFLGRHPRELAYRRLEEIVSPEEAAVCREGNIQVFETRRPMHTEEWLQNAAGEKRLIAITKTPKLDAQGNVEYVVCAGVDMTDQRRMETALRESEARFRHIFEFSPVGIELYDRNGRLILANPACLEIFGVEDPQQIFSFDLFADPNLDESLKRRLRQGETVQYEVAFDFEKVRRAGLYRTSKEGIIHLYVIVTPIRQQGDDVPTGFLALVSDITERVVKEEQIRESKERFALAIQGTDAGVWDWYVQTGQMVVNERWTEIEGYTLEELAPISIQTWIDLCHPEDLKQSNQQLKKHFAGETDLYQCECRMKHKDGAWVWVLVRGKVMSWDQDGKPMRMTGMHVDITESKRSQVVLQAERDMGSAWSAARSLQERLGICLRTAIQVASMDGGGFYVLDETDGSLALSVHQGFTEEFVREVSCYSEDSDNVRLVRQGVPAYIKTEDLPGVGRDVLLSEEIKSVAIVPLIFDGGAVGCLNVASRSMDHIPEHARTALERVARYASSFVAHEMHEEKIRESRRDLDTLLNTIQDMLFILDREGKILHINRVAAEKLGYPADQLIGKPALFIHPEDLYEEARAVIASMQAAEADTCSIPLKTRDGKLIPVETKVVRGHWKGREAIIGICRDTSERLELERRVRQVEKAESLNRMAGAIAHHFNNQLQGVMGNLELAMFDQSPDSVTVKNLTDAMKAARRAAEVSGLMLTYLGQGVSKRSPLDLSEACRLGLPSIAAAMPKNVVLETDLPLFGPAVHGDASQLQEVMTHLVANAWEAMVEGGGTIHLGVKAVAPGDIPATHRLPIGWQPKEKGYACLEVRDTGPGISQQDMEKLFDPFFSTKFTGRGLGLPVVLGIVRAHGGCITAESRFRAGSMERGAGRVEDKESEFGNHKEKTLGALASLGEKSVGSVFRVYLPLSAEEAAAPVQKTARVSESKGGGKALLIEDDPQVRDLGVRMLQRLGYTALSARDGMEGIEMFRDHRDEIRFVVSDLTMPRMDGWETIAALREIDPNVLIILASGYDEASVMSGDHPERPQVFLGKPYTLEDLRSAISKVIEPQRDTDAHG